MSLPGTIRGQKILRVAAVFAAVLLQACAGTEVAQPEDPIVFLATENSASFGQRPTILLPDELHQLSTAQIKHFLAFMSAPDNARYKKNKRLSRYLEQITFDFQYEGDTLAALTAVEQNKGNCLSLAIVTTALAKVAGLDVDYQLMDDVPVYEQSASVITKGVHVRSIIYDPDWIEEEGGLIQVRPGIRFDYFPTNRERFIRNIDEDDYLAMYYRNIAAEAIAENDLNSAYWHAIESFKYEPNNSPAINMLAVINRRAGNVQAAERLYLLGITHADDKLDLLKNYRLLLMDGGRMQEADQIEKQLETMDDPSPFRWIHLARSAHDDGDYSMAVRYFNRAIELAPYLHEAYLGIAQSNYESGQKHLAEGALATAVDVVQKVSTRNLYQAKLEALSRELHN